MTRPAGCRWARTVTVLCAVALSLSLVPACSTSGAGGSSDDDGGIFDCLIDGLFDSLFDAGRDSLPDDEDRESRECRPGQSIHVPGNRNYPEP